MVTKKQMNMKKSVKIFALVSVFASLVACQKYADYSWVPYASLDTESMKVSETEGGVIVSLPVHVYNAPEGCSVAYDITDISAQQGLDYTVVDGTGVLNFAAGETSKDLQFNIVGQPGVYTGDTKFKVSLKSATNEVTIGSINACTISIADKDHPLTSLFGTYEYHSMQLDDETEEFAYYGWKTLTLSQVEGEAYKVWIDKLFVLQLWYPSYLPNNGGGCYANVSKDLKTISIPVPQDFHTSGVNLFGEPDEWYIWKCDQLSFSTEEGEIVFTLDDQGRYVTTDDFGLNTEAYIDDLFYYGMNALSSLDPSKPTYFKKL